MPKSRLYTHDYSASASKAVKQLIDSREAYLISIKEACGYGVANIEDELEMLKADVRELLELEVR